MDSTQEMAMTLGYTYLSFIRSQQDVLNLQQALKEAQASNATLVNQIKSLDAENDSLKKQVESMQRVDVGTFPAGDPPSDSN